MSPCPRRRFTSRGRSPFSPSTLGRPSQAACRLGCASLHRLAGRYCLRVIELKSAAGGFRGNRATRDSRPVGFGCLCPANKPSTRMTVTFGLSSALVVGQALKVGLLARFVQSLWQRCAVGLLVKRHRYMGAAPTWPISP